MCLNRMSEVFEDVPSLQIESHDCREYPFDVPAACYGLGPEADLPPHDRMADNSLTEVVGGLYALNVDEGPKGSLQLEYLPGHAGGLRLRTQGGITE